MDGARVRRHSAADRLREGAEREEQLGPILAPYEPPSYARPAAHRAAKRWPYVLWGLGIVTLFCLHFPHLLADFPNHSPWMDYSKYTDEGWYGNAAIRHSLTGHWYLHGDFNPAVALPVWPLLLAGVFHFTGVSLAADRCLALAFFGLDLVLAWFVVRTQAPRGMAFLAVTLLAASPFLWAFSRLGILESPLICFLLLSWLLALRLAEAPTRARTWMLVAIGFLVCLMVLTKTTAIFVLPSTLFLVARASHRWRTAVRAVGVCVAAAVLPWCGYYFLLARPHYRVDYHYLFEANYWPEPTTFAGWVGAFWWALHGVIWVSPILCAATVAVLLLTMVPKRRSEGSVVDREEAESAVDLWRSPLTAASLLAIAGYILFIGWHDSPQPRYYQVVMYPLCFLLCVGMADLLSQRRRAMLRVGGAAAMAAGAVASTIGVIRIAGYLRHPEYSFVEAARGVARSIDAHPGPHRLLLSISGDSIELITGMPAICDDFGTWDLPYRIYNDQPGWFAEWNEIDPGTQADIETLDSIHPVASFPAFDDPDRNVLVLYRLDPLPAGRRTYSVQDEARENAGR